MCPSHSISTLRFSLITSDQSLCTFVAPGLAWCLRLNKCVSQSVRADWEQEGERGWEHGKRKRMLLVSREKEQGVRKKGHWKEAGESSKEPWFAFLWDWYWTVSACPNCLGVLPMLLPTLGGHTFHSLCLTHSSFWPHNLRSFSTIQVSAQMSHSWRFPRPL